MQAALVAARSLEGKACTFVPQVTPRARTARSRSARELSLGDSVLREAKLVSKTIFRYNRKLRSVVEGDSFPRDAKLMSESLFALEDHINLRNGRERGLFSLDVRAPKGASFSERRRTALLLRGKVFRRGEGSFCRLVGGEGGFISS